MGKRSKHDNKSMVLLYDKPIESITKARQDFISDIIKTSNYK